MKRTSRASPTVINAKRTYLPDCEVTADTIIQSIIEGYPDLTREIVVDRKEAA